MHRGVVVRSENAAAEKAEVPDINKPSEKVLNLVDEVMQLNMYESIQFLDVLKVDITHAHE